MLQAYPTQPAEGYFCFSTDPHPLSYPDPHPLTLGQWELTLGQ